MSSPPRVLVVDDSAFVRKVIREVLLRAGIDVVDHARDGLEALEKIDRLRPDVVTLDLMMPHLDGLGVLEQLAEREDPPSVVVVSISGSATEAGVEALQRGALTVIEKPTALASGRLYELGEELVDAVRLAASARPGLERMVVPPPEASRPVTPAPRVSSVASAFDVVVIGASTGGPQALTKLLSAIAPEVTPPLAIALHIPVGYTEALAARLDRASPLSVVEASDEQVLVPRSATIARAGLHLTLQRRSDEIVARLGLEPITALHRPSVDVLFASAAEAFGSRVLAVVLTGMGQDGLEGARALRERGATILTESESSCVVWGMPRAIVEAGLADEQVPLSSMARAIADRLAVG